MSSRDDGNFVARTGTVRALNNISAGDDDEGGEDQQERNVRRTFRTGTVRVLSRSNNVDVKLLVKGRCRTPTIVGAGCLLIINKGKRSFPRSEPIEDRIEIRDYPDLLRRAGAGNTATEKNRKYGLGVWLNDSVPTFNEHKTKELQQRICFLSVVNKGEAAYTSSNTRRQNGVGTE